MVWKKNVVLMLGLIKMPLITVMDFAAQVLKGQILLLQWTEFRRSRWASDPSQFWAKLCKIVLLLIVTKVCFPNKNIFLERCRFTVWTLSFPLLQNNRVQKEPFQIFTPLIKKTFFGVWQEKYVMNVLDMLWLIAV